MLQIRVNFDDNYEPELQISYFLTPLYTGGLFHCYIFVILGVSGLFVAFIQVLTEIPVSKHCRP